MSSIVIDQDLLKHADDETKAGNYFVANYPPFSFWSDNTVGALDDVLAQSAPPPTETPLGVYFHVPFCRKRCHFCYFRVYTDKNANEISDYLEAGLDEFSLMARQPYLKGRTPRFVYFGGGTPSYLSVKQLNQLTEGMKEIMPWDDAEEVAFEAEPGTLTEAKLDALRQIGVTRLSLGVENFDDHILDINGRAHRSKEVFRAYEHAKNLGFPQINIDLIAGMVDETEANWEECVRRTIELSPDSVTIYQMEVPYNTTIFKQMRAEGRLTAPVATWKIKRDWVAYAFAELEKAGYTVTSAYTAVKNPDQTKFLYRDLLWTGADLLGLGVASFGHLGGVHYQNLTDFVSYVSALANDKQPLYRAYETNSEERFVREFLLQMKLGAVSRSYFRDKFDDDPLVRFAPQFEAMRANGLIASPADSDSIEITRPALLRIDALLHAFFLEQHQNSRYT